MADQNFMDLASKTASGIGGTDYMMLVNNSEAYKALVNDVAEAILSKLTSKSFSGLETTAKNVIGALNELNSKTYYAAYENGENIPENSDLNDYFDIGVYHITNNTAAATIKNYPPGVSTGGRLEVCECGSGWIHQILYPNNGADIYIRYAASVNWYKINALAIS